VESRGKFSWVIKRIISKEIENTAKVVQTASDKVLKQKALDIATFYLEIKRVVDPITLARAAFYVALKETGCDSRIKRETMIRGNGDKNRWWIYLVPVLERYLATR